MLVLPEFVEGLLQQVYFNVLLAATDILVLHLSNIVRHQVQNASHTYGHSILLSFAPLHKFQIERTLHRGQDGKMSAIANDVQSTSRDICFKLHAVGQNQNMIETQAIDASNAIIQRVWNASMECHKIASPQRV